MKADDIDIKNTEVVLYLGITVKPENRQKFLDFCKRAFPIYESLGNNKMVLYENIKNLNQFEEVGYYLTLDDYKRAEQAIETDPIQSNLIKEWRLLLADPPSVKICKKILE